MTLDNDSNLNIPYNLIDNGSTDNCSIQTFNVRSEISGRVISEEREIPERDQQVDIRTGKKRLQFSEKIKKFQIY